MIKLDNQKWKRCDQCFPSPITSMSQALQLRDPVHNNISAHKEGKCHHCLRLSWLAKSSTNGLSIARLAYQRVSTQCVNRLVGMSNWFHPKVKSDGEKSVQNK